MAISVNWGTKVIYIPKADTELVQSTPVEIRNLDLNSFRLTLKDLEDDADGMSYTDTHSHNTTVTVGGVDLARVIEILEPYTITFEDGQYAVNLINANSNVGDRVNVNQVSVRSANSAGLIGSAGIEYGEYGGGVTLDVDNGEIGSIYPIGTPRRPSNNLSDTKIIAEARGFNIIFINNNYTFGTTDVLDGYTIKGENPDRSIITIPTDADIQNCAFENSSITGYLDGGCSIKICAISDLNYVDGYVEDCILNVGTIILNGPSASFIRCVSGVPGVNTPIIDIGGSGTSVAISDYNGGIKLINKTGIDAISIDMSSGHIILDSTITNGLITCRGISKLTNNANGDAIVASADLLVPARLSNVQHLIENTRDHHTGTGNIWYWDPYSGNNVNDGASVNTAAKTFKYIHDNLVINNNHDIVVCVAGDPSGITEADEGIEITKNYTFVRGPGRDFHIHPTTTSGHAVTISGSGVEISGFTIDTEPGDYDAVRVMGGDFAYIEGIWTESAGRYGMYIEDSKYTHIEGGYIRGMGSHGIYAGDGTNHLWVNCGGIHGAGGDGVHIEGSGTYEIKLMDRLDIHWCSGYGVNVVSSSSLIRIDKEVTMESCSSGDINDPNNKVVWAGRVSDTNATNEYLLNAQLSDHIESGSFGEAFSKILGLAMQNYVEDDVVRDGNGNKTSSTLYIYDTAANATIHNKATGLLFSYNVTADYVSQALTLFKSLES